ncbi:MBL fold metallo-hydrolase [Pseudodesulfovibrio sp. zrk46]|uniref:MBL fold metallo-hydrolase n=1 Tax=Pseudodesulfovibrio sp. zrk46 TaxID=2725288 RepID=UPI0014497C76|nr:MBL fold metallo-hydrolase [Pseudodesulfovibrio sp. zrk46]QJB56845.1 MBL fold metallo-hydrolase [Pseudodesulfovibrio sp. zrk46]
MDISITYIHHSCFVLKTPARAYLFDYPNVSHLPDGAEALVREQVRDTDLFVLISHSHDDHLNDDMVTMAATASSVHYIYPDDVPDMRPGVIPEDADGIMVEPDETYEYNGLTVETLMSNDLGVAYLVDADGFRFYYGGDLAKWIWKTASAQEAAFTANFFKEAMDRVRDFKPHVVFSNVDKRLENLGGGVEAYRQTGAEVFVPMHTFGETDWLPDFRTMVGEETSQLFIYEGPGDGISLSVSVEE